MSVLLTLKFCKRVGPLFLFTYIIDFIKYMNLLKKDN